MNGEKYRFRNNAQLIFNYSIYCMFSKTISNVFVIWMGKTGSHADEIIHAFWESYIDCFRVEHE